MNALWLPENIQRRHPEFAKAYDLLEVDKQVILGSYKVLRLGICVRNQNHLSVLALFKKFK